MNSIIFVSLILIPLVFGQSCPLNTENPGSPPVARALRACPEYASSSCCSISQDEELYNNTQAKIVPLFGNEGCYNNIRKLLCSWVCSPNQENLTAITGTTIKTVTMYIAQAWASGFYDSCKGRCLKLGGEVIIGALWGTPDVLLNQFESANDRTYVADATHPNLIFSIGTSPSGENLTPTELPVSLAVGDDLTGCDEGSKNGAAAIFISFFLMFVALFA